MSGMSQSELEAQQALLAEALDASSADNGSSDEAVGVEGEPPHSPDAEWSAMLLEERRAALAGERGQKAMWKALVEVEQEARAFLPNLHEQNPEKNAAKSDAVRAWWAAWADLSAEVARSGGRFQPFPAEALLKASRVASDLGRGILSELVADIKQRGRSAAGWAERYDRACAAAYLARVNRGEVTDKRPNQTVKEAYGFRDVKRTASKLRGEADGLRQEFPTFWRMAPDSLREKLEQCGARFKKASGTFDATHKRNAKRQ